MNVLDLRGPGPDHERWHQLCARSAGLEGPADDAAREVIAAVRERGDAAVAELTLSFEGRDLGRFELTPGERAAAIEAIPSDLRAALQLAADNIRRFHTTQLPRDTGLHTRALRRLPRLGLSRQGRPDRRSRHADAGQGNPRRGRYAARAYQGNPQRRQSRLRRLSRRHRI